MKPLYFEPIEKPEADCLFEHLLGLDWLSVTEARQEYFMAEQLRSYKYGKGVGEREYHSSPYTFQVDELQTWLNDFEGPNQYNVCFLNRYDSQKHQLGWHADDSPSMDGGHPIAVVSLGAEREIWWKQKDESGLVPKEQRQLLKHGSVFIMPSGFQTDHLHRIPKCDRACGTRISLTFRRYI